VTLAVALGVVSPAVADPRAPEEHPLENREVAAEALGDYERQALERALELRDFVLVDRADGKTVRRIHILNLNVFDEDAGSLRWINALRRPTREHVIAREILRD
jgi:hypothetical protein